MKRLLFTSVGKVATSIPGRRRDAARVTVERLSKMDQTGYFRYFARRLITDQGVKNSTGKPFTVGMIRAIRYKHRILDPSLPVGTLNVSQVRERYGVSLSVVYYWIERGIVSAVQRKSYR